MSTIEIANRYYDAFRGQLPFADVPFAASFSFRGPNRAIEGADAFRGVVEGLARQLKDLTIRHQHGSAESVVTVYDFDLGLADGPIAMAEVLEFEAGEIAAIELLFDPGRLAGGA